tara:strand:- start:1432 stop:1548 length:117 start_codon:yes stop_codon:yes gene_type:complete
MKAKKNKRQAKMEALEYVLMYLGFIAMITMIIYNLINH